MVDNFDKKENLSDNGIEELHDSDDDIVFEDEEDTASPAALKKLRDRLKKSESDKQEYLAGWQRCKADFVNARRKDDLDRQLFAKRAAERFIEELLPVLDSFDMAFGNRAAWETTPKEWRLGIEHIYSQLISALQSHGVIVIDPLGEQFDPALHTSILSEPTDKSEEDHRIIEVLQKGYRIDDRIIRSPKVKIAVYEQQQENANDN